MATQVSKVLRDEDGRIAEVLTELESDESIVAEVMARLEPLVEAMFVQMWANIEEYVTQVAGTTASHVATALINNPTGNIGTIVISKAQ